MNWEDLAKLSIFCITTHWSSICSFIYQWMQLFFPGSSMLEKTGCLQSLMYGGPIEMKNYWTVIFGHSWTIKISDRKRTPRFSDIASTLKHKKQNPNSSLHSILLAQMKTTEIKTAFDLLIKCTLLQSNWCYVAQCFTLLLNFHIK